MKRNSDLQNTWSSCVMQMLKQQTRVKGAVRMLHMKFGFDEPSCFRYLKKNGNIYVYCPGVGTDQPRRSNYFRIINLQSICPFPLNGILTIFPMQKHERPMLTLP